MDEKKDGVVETPPGKMKRASRKNDILLFKKYKQIIP